MHAVALAIAELRSDESKDVLDLPIFKAVAHSAECPMQIPGADILELCGWACGGPSVRVIEEESQYSRTVGNFYLWQDAILEFRIAARPKCLVVIAMSIVNGLAIHAPDP